MSCSTFLGFSDLPVRCAGQTLLHRPHSVHANESSSVFHVSSCTRSVPYFSAVSKLMAGGMPPALVRSAGFFASSAASTSGLRHMYPPFLKNHVLGPAKMRCMCLDI